MAIKNFARGESLSWEKYFTEYPASIWTLTYYFRGQGKGFDVQGTATGDKFLLSISAETSIEASPGVYSYQAFAVNSPKKVLVDFGTIQILPNLASMGVNDSFDNRSYAEKLVEAIDAVMLNKATIDQQSYQIGNRALNRIPIPDLIVLRDKYQRIVNNEKRAKSLKTGGNFLKNINVRFTEAK